MPTLPISYIYFSWWQLGFTTQHSKYKWCYVKRYVSDRFATSKRDFKILVPETFPFPESSWDTPRKAPAGESDDVREELQAHWMLKWSCAGAGGRCWSRQMEEAFGCQSHDGMAQTVSREWGNTAKQGNWEHKDRRRKSRSKPRTSEKYRSRVIWGQCVGIFHLPLQLCSRLLCPDFWSGGWILRTALPNGSRAPYN